MSDYYAHPTAEISPDAVIGAGTKIWRNAQIREGAGIGDGCNIGKDVYIDAGVTIGSRVKIQNGVSVYHGVTVEDDVFIGPYATFTNDRFPRAYSADWQVTPTRIRRGASIGANATIVCGVTVGEYALVGAGAVVTHDVPPNTVVVGNPARPLRAAERPELKASEPVERLRVLLVGYGRMGRNHARVLSGLPGQYELAAIAERDPAARSAAARDYPTATVATGFTELLPLADAVVIASPTGTHAEIGLACLAAGKHCLVEKPLAATAAEARELVTAAATHGVVLQAGHTERFNPAVEALGQLIRGQALTAFSAERLGPDPGRGHDTDVIFDLMIHDLDIIARLAGGDAAYVGGTGVWLNGQLEHATAALRFDSGQIATLTASRITERRVRRLRVTGAECCWDLDYLARSIDISRSARIKYLTSADSLALTQSSANEILTFSAPEPLQRQAIEFRRAIASLPAQSSADREPGLAAVCLAERVRVAVEASRSPAGG